MSKTAIFIFRRDLRIEDNTALEWAMKNYQKVIPIFIFTPEQFGKKNEYRSPYAVGFMLDALADLNARLVKHNSKLHMVEGDNVAALNKLRKSIKFDAVVFNKDLTPYAQKRDLAIAQWCARNEIVFHSEEDYTLHNIGSVLSNDGAHYSVYTAFRNKALTMPVRKPSKFKPKNLICTKLPGENHLNICDLKSARRAALQILSKRFPSYAKMRNNLAYETTRLSAHIKFGTVSIREVWYSCRNGTIRDQLLWREFYYDISYFGSPDHIGRNIRTPNCPNYDGRTVKWTYAPAIFQRWADGRTGFPIVDAGMRQLNQTGYMHNRARLITANFLVKLLNCDWRMGEKYFAQRLTDYDPMVNNGNWQWVAGTGVDRSPESRRIFNPWLQSAKYDKDAEYIKKWVPELRKVPSKHLHKWYKYYKTYNFPAPMIDYEKARLCALRKCS